jgi:nucleotide-binding universal stress UspA family protein
VGYLVVGVDGSEQARRALAWALEEAVVRDLELRVVLVYAPGDQTSPYVRSYAFAPEAAAVERFGRRAAPRARSVPQRRGSRRNGSSRPRSRRCALLALEAAVSAGSGESSAGRGSPSRDRARSPRRRGDHARRRRRSPGAGPDPLRRAGRRAHRRLPRSRRVRRTAARLGVPAAGAARAVPGHDRAEPAQLTGPAPVAVLRSTRRWSRSPSRKLRARLELRHLDPLVGGVRLLDPAWADHDRRQPAAWK